MCKTLLLDLVRKLFRYDLMVENYQTVSLFHESSCRISQNAHEQVKSNNK